MGPSLAVRLGEGLLVADDWPHVLVEEVGLAGAGLVRKVDFEALNNWIGNSPGQGSDVVSPIRALGDSSSVYSCCWAPSRTADVLSRP